MSERKDIPRKKSKSRWLIPAVIALVLGFVIVQLLLLDETREQQVANETEGISEEVSNENEFKTTNEALRSIDEYIIFVSENNPDDRSIFVSEYISNALNHLTDALATLSEQQNIQINTASFAQLKKQSERIADSEEQEKAMLVKNSFIMISETMESMHVKSSEKLQTELDNLQEMIRDIDGKSNLEKQDDAVSNFLEQAGIVLELIESEA